MSKIKPFSEFLANYNNGALDDLLGKKLAEVAEAVQNMSKKGTLTLTIGLKPEGIHKMNMDVSFSAKPPVNNSIPGIMFIDENKNLVANDPNQPPLEGLALVKAEEQKPALKAI